MNRLRYIMNVKIARNFNIDCKTGLLCQAFAWKLYYCTYTKLSDDAYDYKHNLITKQVDKRIVKNYPLWKIHHPKKLWHAKNFLPHHASIISLFFLIPAKLISQFLQSLSQHYSLKKFQKFIHLWHGHSWNNMGCKKYAEYTQLPTSVRGAEMIAGGGKSWGWWEKVNFQMWLKGIIGVKAFKITREIIPLLRNLVKQMFEIGDYDQII